MKCVLLGITAAALAVAASAGPVRPIRSDNFLVQAPSGPGWDVPARHGQWFLDPLTGATNVNSWEFHDDDDALCIAGVVQNIAFDGTPASNIVGFSVLATVQNNVSLLPPTVNASNSHNEVQFPNVAFYQGGEMKDARIAAEFAIAGVGRLPSGQPPYYTDPVSAGTYFIEAVNEQEWAWYCWAPNQPQPFQPVGAFQVPAWHLGDIPPGGTAQVLMQFQITAPGGAPSAMPIGDYRHSVIRASQQMGLDVLYNRQSSLKISHWLDTLLVDSGSLITAPPGQYEEPPPEYISASDASVFFNPFGPGEKPVLHITRTPTNQVPDGIVLDWVATDAVSYYIEYCDDLNPGIWTTLVPGVPIPPVIPSPMNWVDDGTLITAPPIQAQPYRFYRLGEP